MGKKPRFVLFYVALALLAVLLIAQVVGGGPEELEYSAFLEHLDKGHILEVAVGRERITGKLKIPEALDTEPVLNDPPISVMLPPEPEPDSATQKPRPFGFVKKPPLKPGKEYTFTTGKVDPDPALVAELRARGIKTKRLKESFFQLYLIYFLPVLLIIAFWFFILRQGQAGRTAMAFGRSKARLYGERVKSVSFDDVAGCDEAKEELSEVVGFLKSPKKYQNLGGRMPKGVLLVGPPGTGKTLIARAVAGEAKRPFFSLSGSEFVEMFVGVGAARVRDLFQQAKDSAPCIIFIDELDAVGRHRGAGLGGGHDEREQTLNQLLVEMDGFDVNSGVIILAATNRPDVLDPALLRPGRFDRQVVLDAPDYKGREAILKVHAREKPLADDVDLRRIAHATPGFTGADLANVLNEAALLAARRGKEKIGHPEVEEATERVIAGPERKSRRLSEVERRRVAYHEAGHAMVAVLSEDADPVRKISIVPRGHAALGYTMQYPEDDRYLITKSALLDRLKTLLAGRAAERLIFDELSTGAQDDLNKATDLARSMVCRFGMSDKIGPVALGREQRQIFLGRDIAQEERNYSEQTAVEIDKEVRRIIDETDTVAMNLLKKYRPCLERIAETLLEREVLQGRELDEILEKELAASGVPVPQLKKIKHEKAERAAEEAREAEAELKAQQEKEQEKEHTPSDASPPLKEDWMPGQA